MSMEELSSELSEFSQWLRVPNDEIKRARQIAHVIFSWIKEECNFKIDRCRFGGSFAKQTSTLLKLDVDVAIYVNYEKDLQTSTPEEIMQFLLDVKDDWKDILIRNTNLTQKDLSKGKNAVKFDLDGLQFDLCPAINCTRNQYDQIMLLLDRMERDPMIGHNKAMECNTIYNKISPCDRPILIPEAFKKIVELQRGTELNGRIIAPQNSKCVYNKNFMPELHKGHY